jgi:hypothetical protein
MVYCKISFNRGKQNVFYFLAKQIHEDHGVRYLPEEGHGVTYLPEEDHGVTYLPEEGHDFVDTTPFWNKPTHGINSG